MVSTFSTCTVSINITYFVRKHHGLPRLQKNTGPQQIAKTHNQCKNRIYRVILTDESGEKCGRAICCGQRDPLWNYSDKELSLVRPPKFLVLKVVEEHCLSESTGVVVRGRARIDIPKSNISWTQKVELDRRDGFKRTFGGFMYFTSWMSRESLRKGLEFVAAIGGLSVQKLPEFHFASAGLSTARLVRLLFTGNPNGLSLSILADRV